MEEKNYREIKNNVKCRSEKFIYIKYLLLSMILIAVISAISGCTNKSSNIDDNDKQGASDNESNYIGQLMEEIDNDDNVPQNYKAVVKAARTYLYTNNDSKRGVYYYLIFGNSKDIQFTEEEVEYALDNIEINWKENAFKSAEEYSNIEHMSKRGIYKSLYGDEFTQEEVDYAMDNLIADWKENALKRVETYSNTDYMSKQYIDEKMTKKYFDQFTKAETQYAMDNIIVNWKENALKNAEKNSNTNYMSRQGIYDLLVRFRFTKEEVEYAMNNLIVNWKENALKKAEESSNKRHSSKIAIRESLVESLFTEEEVDYAMDNIIADWKKNALKTAEEIISNNNMSKIAIYDKLSSSDSYEHRFTEEEAQYAIDNVEADWKDYALKTAEYCSNIRHMAKMAIYDYLCSKEPYQPKFTEEEAQYAIDNIETDWKENALKTAEGYIMYQEMSKEEVRDKLSSTAENGGKFTEEEANYAMDNIEADQKKNALKKAEYWASGSNEVHISRMCTDMGSIWLCMSKLNINDSLIETGFTEEEAKYALDNVEVNWKENALKTAENYLKRHRMSKMAIYDYLIQDKFTKEEVQYALDNVEADWKENALWMAEEYSNSDNMSKIAIYDCLIASNAYDLKFTEEEAQYAIDNVEADWKENALKKAEDCSNERYMSKIAIYDYLTSKEPYQSKFTEEEAQYAVDNIEADWKENALKSAENYSMHQKMSKMNIRSKLSSAAEDGGKFTQEEVDYAMDNIVADQKKNALSYAEDLSNEVYRRYRSKMYIYDTLIQYGFTKKEADYAMNNIEVNWKSNALKKAEYYSKNNHMSKKEIYDTLISKNVGDDKFTEEEAQYAIDNVESDWKENALKTAEYYSNNCHKSKMNIYDTLISKNVGDDKFTKEEAQYAIDNIEANWKENALKTAEYYSNTEYKSKQYIYYFLIATNLWDGKFTEEEAQYAIDNIEVDWKEIALKKAEEYSNECYMSKVAIYDSLIEDDFTEKEAQYAVDNIEADWKENALKKTEYYSGDWNMSKKDIYDTLISKHIGNDKFTEEEAQYAVDNVEADWKENALKKAEYYSADWNMSKEKIRIKLSLTSKNGDKFTKEEVEYAMDNLK